MMLLWSLFVRFYKFHLFFFSCMKSLKYPLLTAQLEQLEGIEEHPFRHLAAEIIVSAVTVR